MGQNIDAPDIRPYLQPGHAVDLSRRVLELEPLLQQVAAICEVQEGEVILHVGTSFCQRGDKNKEGRGEEDDEQWERGATDGAHRAECVEERRAEGREHELQ